MSYITVSYLIVGFLEKVLLVHQSRRECELCTLEVTAYVDTADALA